jgi:predicted heme/steroid binding protein
LKRSFVKKLIMIAMLVLSLALLAGCAAQAPQATATPEAQTASVELTATATPTAVPTASPTATPTATPTAVPTATAALPVFTAEELAKFDGQNGNPAYIAVDGKVYDVTNVPQWKGGSHFGRYQAGRDLTVEIKTVSPHGLSKLTGLTVVGTYEP